jgi:hypothetical protein
MILDGSKATFLVSNDAGPRAWIVQFVGAKNITLNLNWQGTNHTDDTNGIGGVWFTGGNSAIDYSYTGYKMFDCVRVGEGEDPAITASTVYEGNHDFNLRGFCVDVYYGAAVYLTSNVNIWLEISRSTFGADTSYRAVYLEACNNVRAVSRSKNMAVPDGVNCICIGPRYTSPQMVGCTNIWLDATDLGTTQLVAYQRLVKVYQVTTTNLKNTSANQDNIHINVTLTMSATVWGSNPVVTFSSLGDQGTCLNTYTNVFVSGRVTRLVANNYRLLAVDSDCTGLSSLGLTVINFHDTLAGNRLMECLAANIPVEVQTYLSDYGSFYATTPAVQHLTAH